MDGVNRDYKMTMTPSQMFRNHKNFVPAGWDEFCQT